MNLGLPGGSDNKDSACNSRDPGSIPGLGRSPGEGNGNPLQYSCLENSVDNPGRLQFMGLCRVEYDCTTNTFTFHIESRLLYVILDILAILIIPVYEQFPFICAIFNFCNHLLFCRLCSLVGQYPW